MQSVEGPELLEAVETPDQVSEGDDEGTDGGLGGERPLSEEGLGALTKEPGPLVAAPGPPRPPKHPAVLEHQPDGVQASSAMTNVISVMKGGPDGIERLSEAGKLPPGPSRAARDTSLRAVAAQPLGPDGLKRRVLHVAQRAGAVVDCPRLDGHPLPSARLCAGGDGNGDGAHFWPAVVSSPDRRLMRQAWISAIPRLSLSESSRPERWM